MAKTIDHLTLTVGVSAYEHNGIKYDALLIIVAYYKGRGFCVSWQPVKLTGYGYQTGPMSSSDPLEKATGFVVRAATKNSVNTLEQMRTNLEAAREGITHYFDRRDFDGLKELMCDVANYGYPYDREQQIKQLINNNINNQNSEVMENKTNNNQESVNVQDNAQVENVNVGEMTVDSIMPRMSAAPEEPVKVEGSEYQVSDGKGGSVTFESVIPAAIAKPEPVVIDEEVTQKPQVTLRRKVKQNYKHVALPAKNGGEWSKVYGFASEKEAQAMADRLPNSVKATWDYGENQEGRETKTRHYYLRFGVRYLEVAAELADALNQGDKAVVARVVAKAHGVYAGAVADGKAEDAAKKAAKGETKPRGTMPKANTQERKPRGTMPKTQPAATQGKTYTAADMEALVRAMAQAMATAQGADVKQFEPLVQAAMKKAA